MQITTTSVSAPAAEGAGTGSGSTTNTRLKQACQQFEGQFFSLMLQEMRKTIPKDPLLGDDEHTEEIFTQMMDEQVAQEMAKHGGPNDLAEQMYRQLAGASSQPNASATAQAAAATGTPSTSPDSAGPGQAQKTTSKGTKAAAPTAEAHETSR